MKRVPPKGNSFNNSLNRKLKHLVVWCASSTQATYISMTGPTKPIMKTLSFPLHPF